MDYHSRQILVTGGVGFLGSNLVLRLVELGSRVMVLDSSDPGCGANPFNLSAVESQTCLIIGDFG